MYLTDTVLAVILLVFEMLKIPSIKVEAHFLKKLAFVTTKCLAQDASENIQGKQKTFPNTQHTRIVLCINFLIISYILQSCPRH